MKYFLIASVVALVLVPASVAATHYLITSPRQIKPSVRTDLRGHLSIQRVLGSQVDLCATGGGGKGCGQESDAVCPPNTNAIGGGWVAGAPGPTDATVNESSPFGGPGGNRQWRVIMTNHGASDGFFSAVAVCARIS